MLNHELMRDDAILVVTPDAELSSEDFEGLASAIDPFIEEHGSLAGLMIKTNSFPGWEGFGGLVSHIRFVRDHHRLIERVAVVSDAKVAALMPKIVDHFVGADIRQFPFGEAGDALEWLRGA